MANLSIEKVEGAGTITGHVRIRSKTQGIALSLGDKITLGAFRVVICGQCAESFFFFCSAKGCGQGALIFRV